MLSTWRVLNRVLVGWTSGRERTLNESPADDASVGRTLRVGLSFAWLWRGAHTEADRYFGCTRNGVTDLGVALKLC